MASRMENLLSPQVEMPAIAFTTGSAQLGAQTNISSAAGVYRLCATADCYYILSGNVPNPQAATVNSARLPANAIEYVQIPAGGYISVIGQTASGNLSWTRAF